MQTRYSFLFTTFAVILMAVPGFGQIMITEIMYNAAGTDTGFEWVEVFNAGPSAEDISGWKIRDEDSNSANWGEFPASTMLNPGQVLIMTQSSEADFKAAWPTATDAIIYTTADWGSIANTVDTIDNEVLTLLDDLDATVDVANYLTISPWPEGVNGSSIYVIPGAIDPTSNDDGANWLASVVGMDGAVNPVAIYDLGNIGSPGVVVVPEVSTYALLLGLFSLVGVMIRRRR